MVKLVNPQSLAQSQDLASVVWAALEKVGKKEFQSDALQDGSRHRISIRLDGNVDGKPFSQIVETNLSVGHASTRTSSTTPQLPELLAYVLGKLNRATRHRLLSDIPVDFQQNDNELPETSAVLVDEVKQMLKQLRKAKLVETRGPIRCEYTLEDRPTHPRAVR